MTEASLDNLAAHSLRPGKRVKLVVWDLDNTIWDGILLEDRLLVLRPGVADIIRGLDDLGVLQSIASRNDHAAAMARLEQLGLSEYFLSPEISWSAKSAGIGAIASALNLSLDTVLFIDDQPFELEEVVHTHAEVRTLNAEDISNLLSDPHIRPAVVTDDGKLRRVLYLQDQARQKGEDEFVGPPEEFTASLNMTMHIERATRQDLDRVEEMTLRTNQLNSTGYIFSRDELDLLIESKSHALLIVKLQDRFGDYGKIGLVLIELGADGWNIKLLIVSCRVLSRGIGPILLNYVAARASDMAVPLRVEFRDTGKNRPMKIALMMAGFQSAGGQDGASVFIKNERAAASCPAYIQLVSSW